MPIMRSGHQSPLLVEETAKSLTVTSLYSARMHTLSGHGNSLNSIQASTNCIALPQSSLFNIITNN